jgi:hypothetical protein
MTEQPVSLTLESDVAVAIPTGKLMATLEALLPQYQRLCRTFYRRHSADAQPVAANLWLHRELIERFGPQAVLGRSRTIAKRLDVARQDVLAGGR